MRTQTTTLFTNLSKETVKNLVTEVKETLAYDINNGQHKTFSSADLWNIQRQRRVFNIRRSFWLKQTIINHKNLKNENANNKPV